MMPMVQIRLERFHLSVGTNGLINIRLEMQSIGSIAGVASLVPGWQKGNSSGSWVLSMVRLVTVEMDVRMLVLLVNAIS